MTFLFLFNLLDLTIYTLFSSNKVNIKSDQFTVVFPFFFFLIISCTITHPSLIRYVKNYSQISTTVLSIDIHHPPSLNSSWKSKQTKLLPLKSDRDQCPKAHSAQSSRDLREEQFVLLFHLLFTHVKTFVNELCYRMVQILLSFIFLFLLLSMVKNISNGFRKGHILMLLIFL